MSKKESSRKPLIIGIIAAVVILAVLLVLLLTQCMGGEPEATKEPTATTGTEVQTYALYWNADRAEYDGKSEAGMSSRMPESDGYFHVRFILDGEEVILKVAERKLINAIDVKDLMGLTFDENGVVNGVLELDDMPLEKLGWQFYVQSAAKKLIKLNSSESMNGMEVLLELNENSGVYDMTGLSGPKGVKTDAISMDRVYAIANLAGEVTHVFIYQRPNYMLTHEAECQHCKKTVTWYEWTKTDTMPVTEGHYQLMNDIQLKKQPAQKEDSKICIDLNGKRVDGASGARVYAMFNANTELAIMDTSEGQTGVMAAHGKGDQGMVVWVRYGQFHLYGGTLDASDATTKLQGTAVECGKGKYFYMHGGTIIGGKAEPRQNDKGQWTAGLGGAIYLGGKFVMNGGEIRGGNAAAVITKYNADGTPNTYARGMGGNIFMTGSAVMEMNGGTIKGGKAGNLGGNIYMDGASELTINDGLIYGGTINGKGRNGGNLYVTGKAKVTQNGGSILGGTSRNCAGNVYVNGLYVMNGGVIADGVIRDFKTGKVQANAASANVFVVNGKFHMYGGKVAGYFQAIDTSATDTKDTTVLLSGYATIDGGEKCTRNLTLSAGGSGITVYVGNMLKGSRVGVHATTGIFTEPTKESNKSHFFSDIEGAEIIYWDGCLALGRVRCVCGKSTDKVTSDVHINGCDGELHLWAPWTSTSTIPTTTGKYYLLKDVTTTGQTTVGNSAHRDVMLDTNGKNVTLKVSSGSWDGFRLYRVDNGSNLVITDTTDKPGTFKTVMPAEGTKFTGKLLKETVIDEETGEETKIYYEADEAQTRIEEIWKNGNFGMLLWARGGNITVHNGIFDGSNLSSSKTGMVASIGNNTVTDAETGEKTPYYGSLTMYGGKIIGGTVRGNGGISVSGKATLNLHGGEITGGRVDLGGVEVDGGLGGNIFLEGTMNMTGGKVTDGYCQGGTKGGGHGGNIAVSGGLLNVTGGEITGGWASSAGGNIGSISTGSRIVLSNAKVTDGQGYQGGNVSCCVRTSKLLEIKDGTVISGGTAKQGGNVYLGFFQGNSQDMEAIFDNAIIRDGVAIQGGKDTGFGGNIYIRNTTSDRYNQDTGKLIATKSAINVTFNNTKVEDGEGIRGGNIWMERANVTMNETTVSGGLALHPEYGQGGNIYIGGTSNIALNEGTVITGGKADSTGSKWCAGGNIYMNNGNMTVDGAVIKDGDARSDGNNIYINGSSVVTLESGSFEGGIGKNENVYMQGGKLIMNGGKLTTVNGEQNLYTNMDGGIADITINGGEIIGAEFAGNGANIYLSGKTKFVMNGGLIKGGNSTTGAGGNLALTSGTKDETYYSATFEMNGGTIEGGKSKYNGGNVCVLNNSVFTLNDGVIRGGHCDDSGGNMYVNGYLNMHGGVMENATAKSTSAYNLFLVNGDAVMTGGEVKGGMGMTNTDAEKLACTLKVSGTPVISKGETGYGLTMGTSKSHMPQVEIVEDLKTGASIYVNTTGYISKVTDEKNVQYFHAANEAFTTLYDQQCVFIGQSYCLCGGKDAAWCDHEKLAWAPYSSSTVAVNGVHPGVNLHAPGNYYLTESKTKGQQNINADIGGYTVNFDLRGFKWEASSTRTFLVQKNHVLGITDTVGGGSLVGKGHTVNAGNVLMQGTSTLNLYAGTITQTQDAVFSPCAGNVELADNSVMNMYGGVVENGIARDGGNIYVRPNATLNVFEGAVIRGGKANKGGNICTEGALDIQGGKVLGGKAYGKTIDAVYTNTYGYGGNIYATGAKAIVNITGKNAELSGGYVCSSLSASNTRTWSPGGNIYVNSNSSLTVDGGAKIFGGDSTDGHNIYMTGSKSKVELKDTTITNTSENSTSIMVQSGTLTVNGATLITEGVTSRNLATNNSTYDDGNGGKAHHAGNIIINSGTVTGGKIAGSGKNGGNIYIGTADTLTVNGGLIENGSSEDSGGNIAVYGTANIHGGIIRNGVLASGTKGHNIAVIKSDSTVAATLNITGGTIAGGIQMNNASANVNVSISGNPVIDKEQSTANKPTYSLKLAKNDLTIGELTDGAKIMVSGEEGIFSYAAPAGADKYFQSEVEGLAVWQIKGELVLVYGRYSCICGVNSDNKDDHIEGCDGEKQYWLPVTEIPSTSGYYYLISDVTDSGGQRILTTKENIFLDLNGKTVKSQRGRLYRLEAACNIVITDNSANRDGVIEITGQRDQGAAIWLFKGSSSVFSMYAGTIDASGVYHKDSLVSAGLALAGGSGTFKLYGGTVKGGKVHGVNYGGSAIAFEGGKTHILGDMEISSEGGSAIFVANNAKLDLHNVTEKPDTPWAVDASGVFTKNWNKDWNISDYFVSASSSGAQIYLDASGELTMGKYYCECGVDSDDAADHLGDCTDEDIFWMPWRDQTKLPTSGNYYLTRNIIGSIPSGETEYVLATAEIGGTKQTARLDLCGYTVTSGLGKRSYLVKEGNTLVITDSKGGGVLYGGGYADNYGGTIGTESGSVVTLYGGTVTLRDDATAIPVRGAVISVSGTLNVHGGTILVNKNVGSGVLIRDNKKMTMTGGHILNTASNDENGVSNISLWSDSELRISGGIIENTGDNCRNITSDGKIYMEDGTIKGGKLTIAGWNGGNININKNFMEMSGGSVIGGQCANQGGNLVVYGRLTVSGSAVIKDGKSADKSHYNIALIGGNGLLEAKGGTIAGGVGINNSADTGKPNVKLSGKPVIDPAKTSTADLKPATGLSIGSSSNLLDVTGLTGGTVYIKATKAGQFAENATSGMENYFVSQTVIDGNTLPVCYADGGLYFGQVYCLCGFTKDGTTLKAHEYWCDGVDHIWLPFAQDHIVTGGYYYLTGPISRNYQTCIGEIDNKEDPSLNFAVDVVLDLNGHNWTATGRAFRLEMGSLDVTDTVGGATVTGGGTGDQSGVLLGGNTTFNLYAGNWTLKSGKAAGGNGGIMDIGTNTVVNMYSGTISAGNANTTKGTGGGNISIVSNGIFNFYGGTISGGTSAKVGGNICVNGGQFNAIPSPKDVNGVAKREILGGTATDGGSIAVVAGTATIEKTTITGGTATNGGAISVTGGTLTVDGATITGGTATNGGAISVTGGTVTVDGSTVSGGEAVNGGNIYLSAGSLELSNTKVEKGIASSADTHANGGNIYAGGTAVVTLDKVTVSDGQAKGPGTIGKDANNNNINKYGYGGNIALKDSAGLTVKNNTSISGGTTTSNGAWAPGGNVDLRGTSTMDVTSSVIRDGVGSEACNIYMGTGTEVTLNSGTILNSIDKASIVMQAATFNIKGGEITSTAENARNISQNGEGSGNANINISGGKITGAHLKNNNGANLYLGKNAIVTMTAGEISGGVLETSHTYNESTEKYSMNGGKGANVYVATGAVFNMEGGLISGGRTNVDKETNFADGGYGGSIFVAGTFNMSGGTVEKGYVRNGKGGGGLGGNFCVTGTLNITGGTVKLGDAVTGGNIGTNNKAAVIKISGATIEEGTAKSGGNLALNVRSCTEFTIGEGAKILNGQATAGNGGNIGINISQTNGAKPNPTMTIRGATITGGTATGEGGNIYAKGVADDKSHVRIENTTVSGGTGTTTGGVYMNNDNTKLTLAGNVLIDGNNGYNLWLGGESLHALVDGTLASTSKIGIAAATDRYVTDEVSAEEAAYFVADDPNKNTYFDANKVYLGQMHCICGKPDGTCTTYTDAGGNTVGCDGKEIKWTAWTGDTTLPTVAGNYYLTKDVTISTAAEITGDANVILDLNGHTVNGAGTSGTASIYKITAGSLTLTNTVKGQGGLVQTATNKATTVNEYGTLVKVGTGSWLNLYGVDISLADGLQNENGLIGVYGILNIFGDTVIRDGNSATNSGNIYLNGVGTINMFDGVIRDGVASVDAGNMRLMGTLNMYGDALITNSAWTKNSANIQLMGGSAKLNMYGGKITGDIVTTEHGGGNGSITLSGNAQITKGNVTGLRINSRSIVVSVNGKLTGKDPIVLDHATSLERVPCAVVRGTDDYFLTYSDKQMFTTCHADFKLGFFKADSVTDPYADALIGFDSICLVDKNAHMHCECGGTIEDGTVFEDNTTHKCYDLIYTTYTNKSGNMTENRNWVLNGDFELDGQYQTDGYTLNICLNDYNLSGANNTRMFRTMTNGGHITITTCGKNTEKNRVIPVGTAAQTDGGALWLSANGTATTYGVTMDAAAYVLQPEVNTAESKVAAKNGAIAHVADGSTLTSYGTIFKAGTVKYRSYNFSGTTKSATSLGAALAVDNNATFNMYGGSMIGGTYHGETSGDLHAGATATVKLVGDVTFAPKSGKTSIYLNEGGVINVEHLTGVNAPIAVDAQGVFTKGYGANKEADKATFFKLTYAAQNMMVYNNELASAIYTCACGQEEHTAGCLAYNNGAKILWKPARGTTFTYTAGNYYLYKDITANSGGINPNNLAVNLNGYTLNSTMNTRVFSFRNRTQKYLMITDSTSTEASNQGYVKALSNKITTNQGGVIWMGTPVAGEVNTKHKVWILGGNLDASAYTTSSNGAAILVESRTTDNDFYIYGGTITGGTCVDVDKTDANGNPYKDRRNGGTIYIAAGGNNRFHMYGGEIKGGSAFEGGNIYMSNATNSFTMHGGKITGGYSRGKGGNVGINGGTFTIKGGEILNGNGLDCGGNIWSSGNGVLNVEGGKISGGMHNGTAESEVYSNVFLVGNAKFTMTGGEITGHVQAYAYSANTGANINISGNAKIHNGTNTKNLTLSTYEGNRIAVKFGTLTDGAKIGLSALDKYVAGDVIATGITAANNEFLVLDETNWNYNINTGTQEITLVAKASN